MFQVILEYDELLLGFIENQQFRKTFKFSLILRWCSKYQKNKKNRITIKIKSSKLRWNFDFS